MQTISVYNYRPAHQLMSMFLLHRHSGALQILLTRNPVTAEPHLHKVNNMFSYSAKKVHFSCQKSHGIHIFFDKIKVWTLDIDPDEHTNVHICISEQVDHQKR